MAEKKEVAASTETVDVNNLMADYKNLLADYQKLSLAYNKLLSMVANDYASRVSQSIFEEISKTEQK